MRCILFFILLTVSKSLFAQWDSTSFQFVNTAYDEQNPLVSPDGKMLFITVSNHPANAGGKRDAGDVWISTYNGTQWSVPRNAGMPINNTNYNGVIGITNTNDLILVGHYDANGNIVKTQGIAIAKRNGEGWGQPTNINIPYFKNKSDIQCGFISSDNAVFLFSADTYGTHGVDDLYVSINNNGTWSEPKNLGTTINTQFQELSPSLSNDGKTLYFSSNGRKGNGSFDVYTATRMDDSWTNWSVPVNLGNEINTKGRELYYRPLINSGLSIYTSTQDSDGYGDIKLYKPRTVHTPDTSLYTSVDSIKVQTVLPAKNIDQLNDNGIRVYGKISDSKTGEAIVSKVTFIGGAKPFTVSSTDEGYQMILPENGNYSVSIESPGYISLLERITLNSIAPNNLELNFQLQPIAVGTTVNLKSVLFAQTKSDILAESYPELDLVVSFLRENPNVKIELSGHTDNRGIHADNVKLSQQRVNKVKAYLVSKGIDAKRISGKGYGGTKPIASNDTEESRRMNRRVEFTIKKY